MKCSICGQPIVLVPSAGERAKMYGGTPGDYKRMFREHGDCVVRKRNDETAELMQRINKAKPRKKEVQS